MLCGEGTGVSAISAALSALQLSVLPNLESSRQSPSMFHLSATQAKSGDMCASRPIRDVFTGIRLLRRASCNLEASWQNITLSTSLPRGWCRSIFRPYNLYGSNGHDWHDLCQCVCRQAPPAPYIGTKIKGFLCRRFST